MEETKQKTGKFKPTKEFLGFVSNISGTNQNLIRNIAYYNPGKTYGMLDPDSKLKFEIFEDGSVDITNASDVKLPIEQIESILDDICCSEISNYASKNVFNEFKFEDEDGKLCYLHTTKEKPINRLKKIAHKPSLPKESISKFEEIMRKSGMLKEKVETVDESEEEVVEPVEHTTNTPDNSHIIEAFKKMEEDKIKELKKSLEDKNKALVKLKSDIRSNQSSYDQVTKEVKLLKTRLDGFKSKEEYNGYLFSVSDKIESEVDPNMSEETKKALTKICSTINIDYDKVMKMVFSSYYKIFITKEDELEKEGEKSVEKEIISKILSIDIDGEFKVSDDHIIYSGDLEWHEINKVMEQFGFKTDSRFDSLVKPKEVVEDVKIEEKSETINKVEDISMISRLKRIIKSIFK